MKRMARLSAIAMMFVFTAALVAAIEEAAKGPIMIQGDHGPIAVRNLKITPM